MADTLMLLRALAYLGPGKPNAQVEFQRGLNVVCGASDTGKSYIAESVDFMLGGGDTPRDIPERVGYDRVTLTVELTEEEKTYQLERSTGGGDFRQFEVSQQRAEPRVLRAKHSQDRNDSLSVWLLQVMGLSEKKIRKNAQGTLRSLSFRDIARLVILQQGEISSKISPYLTGQYVTKTAEMSALKLVLTGVDDSAVVSAPPATVVEATAARVEVIESVIDKLQSEIEGGLTAAELSDQLERLQLTIVAENAVLRQAQQRLDEGLKHRRDVYSSLERAKSRHQEIASLVARFDLLDKHYRVDLQRLAAIAEAGHFMSYLPNDSCPLCGAAPELQHTSEHCDGNVVAVAEAAEGEQKKVLQLLNELSITVRDLLTESHGHADEIARLVHRAQSIEKEVSENLVPVVGGLRVGYGALVEKASEIRKKLDLFRHVSDLEERKAKLLSAVEITEAPAAGIVTDLSKSVLADLCLVVEKILGAWNFPGGGRVTFDERTFDFVCAGKPRGSFGAGFRAIISAAASIGLLEYCLENDRPHPGFVVLESPLLAYWKPESSEDNLKGSDLKNRFYEYLNEFHRNNQVVVIENEHPPATINLGSRLTVFTRNPAEGRYGFFPSL